ncbi:MAG: CaiB/BaiF CoA transferase family protein [Rhodothalassiaceae bacterium]
MTGPLSHLTILDMSRVLAGPWAGQILADLGAKVVKVERPGAGDDTRAWGPPFLKDAGGRDSRESAYYLAANRGKRSIAIDIARSEGQAIVRKLAARSDALLENYRVGGLRRYGLDYESLAALHPGLVYCSITGFGQTSPLADEPGYDFLIQGMAGLMSITGAEDGPPMKVGTAIADLTTGMYAVIAILAAIAHRERTGEGQHIDMALFDTQLGWLANQNMNYLVGGEVPRRRGNAHPNIVPYQDFATRDGYILVCVGNDRQFARFANAIGEPALAADPRYATNAARVANRKALVAIIAQRMAERESAQWLALLKAARIPAGPVNNIAEAFAHPQAVHRGLRVALDHPLGVRVPTVANPIRFSETAITYRDPPPMLGQHTDAILGELGYDGDAIARLRADGVVE